MRRSGIGELHLRNNLKHFAKSQSNRILAEIPTKTGFHIITNPFDLMSFSNDKRLNFTGDNLIHKNSPTLLYVNN